LRIRLWHIEIEIILEGEDMLAPRLVLIGDLEEGLAFLANILGD
jgi:hypothetical protein